MIVGLGLDMAEIDRIEAAIGRHGDAFKNRLYTPAERAYCESHKKCSSDMLGDSPRRKPR